MKITNVKAMVAKGVTVGLLAGAFVLAAPAKADAQQFAVGVRAGYPAYYGYPAYRYYGPDYYARRRFEQERRHDEWVRAHEYERYHHDHRGRW
ncbi:hypothetical protein [Tunturibacter empetritectus]|uniref:Uncharacterized protein n=1 Tax=Tunturiibacter lichenicola TaxID=2051959 RepID=A0A7W8J6L6_9BACT|nr:hypothetical protein [Edaphobacter lichenicola]MBB5342222.1 hypothetical protein [Edaphobacter lichenicola]